jgi:ankyrin repeat protein
MRYIGLTGLILCLMAGHTAAQEPRPCVPAGKPSEAAEIKPQCDLSFVQIQLESHGRRSGDGPFTMVITGEGTVFYIPSRFDRGWILGPQTYHIAPEQVAIMLDLAEKADFWSLPDTYRPAPLPEDKLFPGQNEIEADVYRRVEITTNSMVKDLRIYDAGGRSDVPQAADELIYKLANLAKRDLWRGFTRETTTQLKQNGFDFHSKRGGEFLIEMTVSPGNSDPDIDSLLDLGAPADYVNTGHFLLETGLLDAAIDSGRSAFVDKLIANGALLTENQPDLIKCVRALAHAAAATSPEMVAKLLQHHPPLVLRTKAISGDAAEWNNIPVITLVGQNKAHFFDENTSDTSDQIAVTQQLLDAGANINDRGNNQRSLLDNAVHQGNLSFVSWLIAHHAQVTKESFVPVLSDEMTVLLLDTAPQLDNETRHQIAANAEPKTKVWLKAHGKWPAE